MMGMLIVRDLRLYVRKCSEEESVKKAQKFIIELYDVSQQEWGEFQIELLSSL